MSRQEKWRETIAKQANSGLNIRDFCRQEKIDEGGFYSWRKRLNGENEKVRQDFVKVTPFQTTPAHIATYYFCPSLWCVLISLVWRSVSKSSGLRFKLE